MPTFLRWFLRLSVINPIAVRLVQGGSRRTRHFYVRAGYLLVLIVMLLWLLLVKSSSGSIEYSQMARNASESFVFVAYLQIVLICLLAPVFMAGAIAQEANPRTWDILLTTPLSAAEIVLGNLFGRLFFIIALLFSSLPLFALTQYYGGVPGSAIVTSYLIAGCAALLVGALAIALSVSRLVGKRAVFAFYVAVVSYLAVTWAIDWLLGQGGTRQVSYVTAINPFLTLEALLNPSTYPSAEPGTLSGLSAFMLETPVTAWCTLSGGLSLLLMGLSTFTVRVGGIAGLGGARGRGGVPWYRKLLGLGASGAEMRPARKVWNSPIAWREAAARNATFSRIVLRFSFITLGLLWAVGVLVAFHIGQITIDTMQALVMASVLGELAVITLVALNMSGTSVAREREDGTLDLLLTTPITPRTYLTGKLRGMVAWLIPMIAVPVATIGLAGLYVLLRQNGVGGDDAGVLVTSPGLTLPDGTPLMVPAILPEAGLTLAMVAVPFVSVCVMVGMWQSLKSKGVIGAVIVSVSVVLVVAGVVGVCAWNATGSIPVLGPALGALSPASAAWASSNPGMAFTESLGGNPMSGLTQSRVALVIGSLASCGIHAAIVYAMLSSMVGGFDMTVRKLAGTA